MVAALLALLKPLLCCKSIATLCLCYCCRAALDAPYEQSAKRYSGKQRIPTACYTVQGLQ
jgi:hypothetical protein